MKTKDELEEYLAGIRKTIAESEAMVQQAELRMAETDRLLAAQGLTREQVMNFRITAEQRRLVNDELKRRGLPVLDEDEDPAPYRDDYKIDVDRADTQGDLENRVRKFRGMMSAVRL